MHQEQQRTIGDTGQTGTKASVEPFEALFVFDLPFDLLPVHTKGGVGEHVVEFVGVELVVGEGVTQFDVVDLLPLDQHISLTDGVALWIELLPIGTHDGLWIELIQILHPLGEETAGACGGVVDGADNTWLGEGIIIFHKH